MLCLSYRSIHRYSAIYFFGGGRGFGVKGALCTFWKKKAYELEFFWEDRATSFPYYAAFPHIVHRRM